jgi:DNA mismatch repair ATPase MutL
LLFCVANARGNDRVEVILLQARRSKLQAAHLELVVFSMAIKQLPDYLINRLKAGEIVERPASIIKELVENSLDAGAKNIVVTVKDGGKNSIIVEDDGSGIEIIDMDKVLARYATSKMSEEMDLQAIASYGFR